MLNPKYANGVRLSTNKLQGYYDYVRVWLSYATLYHQSLPANAYVSELNDPAANSTDQSLLNSHSRSAYIS